jgi:hypothetical protein
LELDRYIGTWYWLETKFGVAVGTSNILSLGWGTSRTLVKQKKNKKNERKLVDLIIKIGLHKKKKEPRNQKKLVSSKMKKKMYKINKQFY